MYGIDGGTTVGYYSDSTGTRHGFLAVILGPSTFAADFDFDVDVDVDDFIRWQMEFGVDDGADADGDGDSDGDDFVIWQTEFGSGSGSASAAVPEPSSWLLLAVGLALFLTERTRPHFGPAA